MTDEIMEQYLNILTINEKDDILRQYVDNDCLQVINMFNGTLQNENTLTELYNDIIDNLFFIIEHESKTIRINFFGNNFSLNYSHDEYFSFINNNCQERSERARLLLYLFNNYETRKTFGNFDFYSQKLNKQSMHFLYATWYYVYPTVVDNIIKTLVSEFGLDNNEICSLSNYIVFNIR